MKGAYQDEYKKKQMTAKDAAKLVKTNDKIWYGSFNGKPVDVDKALAERKEELHGVIIQTAGSVPPPPQVSLVDPGHEHFTYHSWYFTGLDRKLCDNGLAFYCTINYHECRKVVEELYPPEVGIFQVAPMDDHGFFNFGPNASHHHSVCMSAGKVIVEVNNTVPRCLGGFGEAVHISQVDAIVEGSNTPIFELPKITEGTPEDEKIANFVIEHLEDRVCLQLGIGALPSLVGNKIAHSDLKDLGIHSEMFVDAYVDMIRAGRVTGKYKTTDRGKAAYTFSMGTRECYDFMHDNPMLASCPGDYTNDPKTIARNDRVFSVNNAVEIDLFSQVCGESYGARQISGTGGQLDFAQGAFESRGGKSFMCIHSTTKEKDGTVKSRIVPCLQSGGIVTTPRSVVSYVVTENGVAFLKGKSTWERAEALIAIAHPDFQDELIAEAQRMNIWTKTNKIAVAG